MIVSASPETTSPNPDPKGPVFMRMLISILLCLGLFAVMPKGTANAQDLTIALSPHVSEAERREQGEATLRFLATHLQPGESAEIVNAYDLSPLATFEVPEGRAYENPRAKLNVNRQAVAAVLQIESSSERQANEVQRPINLPGLLRYLGETGPLGEGHDVVIIGSPLYDMPLEANVSMRGGRVPGDGLIRGTRGSSPFGAEGMAGHLSGARIHFVALDTDWAMHDRHAFAVERFTALLVEAHGGHLVSFANDPASVFRAVETGSQTPERSFVLEDTDKLEMLIFPAESGLLSTGRNMANGDLVYTGPSRIDGPVEISLYWPCETCDLDLHVRAAPDAAILSYLRHNTSQGRFTRDVRMGGADRRALETIILNGPVELEALQLWVNFYGGASAGGADSELRVTFGGTTYVRELHIPAPSGDGGTHRTTVIDGEQSDAAWLAITPLALIRE
jgi:hypothetical protein